MASESQFSTLQQIYDFPQICAVRCLGAMYSPKFTVNKLLKMVCAWHAVKKTYEVFVHLSLP